MIDVDRLFDSSRTLPWQPIKVEKSTFFLDQSTLSHCHSETDCNIANSDFKRFNRINFSTLCTILATFGPETPEITLLTVTPFAAVRQKSHITSNISENPGPILTYFTDLVGVLVGIIIPMFVRVKDVLWQRVKFGGCLQTSPGKTFTLCFGV